MYIQYGDTIQMLEERTIITLVCIVEKETQK
jgi:hypothetical protein